MNRNQPWDILRFTGSRTWNGKTLSATAVVASWIKGVPAVKLTAAADHYLSVGSMITIDGTDNYDGTHQLLAGTATTLLYIPHNFVAETTATGDTVKLTLAPGHAFEFGGFKLKLSAVGGTASEPLTITVDAGHAATVYDYQLYREPSMETIQFLNWNIQDNPEPFDKNDELIFAWANAAQVTYGLEVYWRRR